MMSRNLRKVRTFTEHLRISELHVVELQLVPDGYPFVRKRFRPSNASMTWDAGNEPGSVAITGDVVRKDGTSRGHTLVVNCRLDGAPDWVKEVAKELHAHG